jgi:DeoR-like helix-turn-helix domain
MESSKTDMDKTMGGIMVFSQNNHFAYIYKKTEKLVTAVYMITNFIKDNEPLKWRIREKCLELLSLNVSLNTVSLSDRKDLLKKYQAGSVEIVSLSSIGHLAGLISEMNFEVLRREFNNLAVTIEKDENKKASEETVSLNPNFFDTPIAPVAAIAQMPSPAQTGVREHSSVVAAFVAPRPVANPVLYRKPEPSPKKTESKNERQEAILKLLSQREKLSVKDFTDTIKGVSDKTIQRELLLMVSTGVLKKEGERRWSTYSRA